MFLRWNDGNNGGRGVMIKVVIVVMAENRGTREIRNPSISSFMSSIHTYGVVYLRYFT